MSKKLHEKAKAAQLPAKYDAKHAREELKRVLKSPLDPDLILKEWNTKVIPDLTSEDQTKSGPAKKQFTEKGRDAMSIISIDQHYLSAEAVGTDYRTLTIELARELDEEYACTTPSEKALVDLIATSYARYIEAERKFNGLYGVESISHDSLVYYNSFAKEADRAFRQYLTALFALKQLKNPSVEVNVNARTAMISQYQQFITNQLDGTRLLTNNDAT